MAATPRDDVTRILDGLESGATSLEELLPIVYAELRVLADQVMRTERAGHTLQPTALVHEVFVRLADGDAALGGSRRHFLGIAARAMRHLLVDHARRRQADKRGGGRAQVTLNGLADDAAESDIELLDLHAALERLATLDERQALIVEMSFFAGMSGDEIADELGVHRNTVVRDLRMARAWLQRELRTEDGHD
ncbi:MAG: ECF-type sigma factor [bacterium]|nr:ECF-type sigma factor [bacterium]